MADFWGAMFEGIGKTFEAGASVNVAKINRQIAQLNYKTTLITVDNENANQRLQYINDAQQQESKLLAIALGFVVVCLIVLSLIFRKK